MDNQQLEELETYYEQQYHDYFEYVDEEEEQTHKIDYNPNRQYFYYIFTKEHTLIHGDESAKGLYKELISI